MMFYRCLCVQKETKMACTLRLDKAKPELHSLKLFTLRNQNRNFACSVLLNVSNENLKKDKMPEVVLNMEISRLGKVLGNQMSKLVQIKGSNCPLCSREVFFP